MHHYMYGLAGIPVALVIHSVLLFAIALGFVVDEAWFIIRRGDDGRNGYSFASLMWTVLFVCLVLFGRQTLLSFLFV